jgi:hypothetical protein
MRWTQRDLAGSAAALHACEPSAERSITWMIPDEPTWCIGNAQLRGGEWGPAALPADVLDTQGVPCIRRRSGGGAVLVAPNTSLWCDVSIGRFDPLWKADVERSFDWLGELCRRALRTAAPDLPWDCHHGPPLERQAGAALCFAGVGHGELMSGERKAVGSLRSELQTVFASNVWCIPSSMLRLMSDGTGALSGPSVEQRGTASLRSAARKPRCSRARLGCISSSPLGRIREVHWLEQLQTTYPSAPHADDRYWNARSKLHAWMRIISHFITFMHGICPHESLILTASGGALWVRVGITGGQWGASAFLG